MKQQELQKIYKTKNGKKYDCHSDGPSHHGRNLYGFRQMDCDLNLPKETPRVEMNVSKQQIDALVEWLGPRLEPLISHGVNVRRILDAAKRPDEIVASATNFVMSSDAVDGDAVNGNTAKNPALKQEELAVWKAILPLLAEHGIMAVNSDQKTLEPEKPMNKKEAADYLGFSERKLERAMAKRQIAYEKYGAGQTATVRFQRAELERFKESRLVAAGGGGVARRP